LRDRVVGLWRRIGGAVPARSLSRRRSHDLDVVDQWLLISLARFGQSPYRRLEAELAAVRGSAPAEVVAALLRAEEHGLIERLAVTGIVAEERLFRLSKAGKKVSQLLPREPRSPTIFYL